MHTEEAVYVFGVACLWVDRQTSKTFQGELWMLRFMRWHPLCLCAPICRGNGWSFPITSGRQGRSHRRRLSSTGNSYVHRVASSISGLESYRVRLGCFREMSSCSQSATKESWVLAAALQEQWLSLPMEMVDRIIESITHHCMCCIASWGVHISYCRYFSYNKLIPSIFSFYTCANFYTTIIVW